MRPLEVDVETVAAAARARRSASRAARRRARRSTGSAALASLVGEVDARDDAVSSPRANTETSMCGACAVRPRPGLSVTISQPPSSSVGAAPEAAEAPPPKRAVAAPACQVSISASGTGVARAVEHAAADRDRALGAAARRRSGPSGHGSPIEKYGPTVCDGVVPGISRRPAGSRSRRAGRCPTGRRAPTRARCASRSNARDQPLARLRVAHRVEDRVLREQRVAGEVHLRHQPLGERAPEQREVDVRGPPGVGVVAPRVGAGLDRDEPVAALARRSRSGRAR